MDKKEYRRLGGRGRDFNGYSSIWLADDHLLFCEASYIEKYKRFYFKDIQTLMVKKTKSSLVTTIVALVLAIGSLLLLADAKKGWDIFWGILAGFFFFILLINIIKGQSCKAYIQTAVQKEELKGLVRVKKFEKFLKIVEPLVRSFQGEMDLNTLGIKYEESLAKSPQRQTHQPPPTGQDSLLHTVLFSSFIVLSFFIGVVYFFNNVVLYLLVAVVYLMALVLNIRAVVKQFKINFGPVLRNWAWVSLGGLGMFILMGYVSLFTLSFTNALAHRHSPMFTNEDLINAIPDNHFVKGIILAAFAVSLLIGIVGLVLSARPRAHAKPLV